MGGSEETFAFIAVLSVSAQAENTGKSRRGDGGSIGWMAEKLNFL